jgi:hypothetical protein
MKEPIAMARLNINRVMEYSILAITLATLGLVLQISVAAYTNDYGPDEASHYVTSLLIHDYLGASNLFEPWSFAQEFFLHYPKIGLGHWPPAMYGIVGLWMIAFGDTRLSALILILCLATSFAIVIYAISKKMMGRLPAIFCSLIFVLLPLTQEATARVMPEHFVNLLIFLSALQFANFLKTGRTKDSLIFGLICSIAILTRGSAWALGLLPIVSIVLTGTFYNLKKFSFWASSIPVILLAVPWYYSTRNMSEGSWLGASGGNPFWIEALNSFTVNIYEALGASLLIPAFWGVWIKIVHPYLKKQVQPEWAVLAALAISIFILHCLIPVGLEPRYMLALMPSIIIFAAAGIVSVSNYTHHIVIGRYYSSRMISQTSLNSLLFGLLFVGFLVFNFSLPTQVHAQGFDQAAASLIKSLNGRPATYLIISDARGEGSMVASIASGEKRLSSFVLRGSKILVREDWFGRGSVDLFDTPNNLKDILAQIPVDFVLFDKSISSSERRKYHARIEQIIGVENSGWRLMEKIDVVRANRKYPAGLFIYFRDSEPGLFESQFKPNIDLIDTLMKTPK